MFTAQGLIPDTNSLAQLSEVIRRDIGCWKRFIAEPKITPD